MDSNLASSFQRSLNVNANVFVPGGYSSFSPAKNEVSEQKESCDPVVEQNLEGQQIDACGTRNCGGK